MRLPVIILLFQFDVCNCMMCPLLPSNPTYGIFIPPIPSILDFFQVFCRHFVDEVLILFFVTAICKGKNLPHYSSWFIFFSCLFSINMGSKIFQTNHYLIRNSRIYQFSFDAAIVAMNFRK